MHAISVATTFGAIALAVASIAAPVAAQQPGGPSARPAAGARFAPALDTAAVDTAAAADLYGTVSDSASGDPLAGAEIQIQRRGEVIAQAETDRLGTYRIHQVRAGTYTVEARLVGYRPADTTLVIGRASDLVEVSFHMRSAPIQLSAIQVSAAPVTVDTRTGNQVYNQNQAQASPTLTTSAIVQQAIAGAARAPTGEVHIRGQHAEYTYYIDGVPVPPGISGSLNELFDPSVAQQITFQTGSWDAEYGGRNAAIIKVQTRIPSGGLHAAVSDYAGSYGGDGQTLTASTNAGKLGLFVSGTRTESDMRREPVVADTNASGQPTGVRNFSNYGQDQYVFGKMQYTPTANDVMSLDADWSQTHFQTPFDSAAGAINDWERDRNAFVNLAWEHSAPRGPNAGTQFFGALFYRHGTLNYLPGVNDQPSFTFAPDTTLYNVSEARGFDIYGINADYTVNLSEQLSFKFGTLSSITRGHEDFQAFNATNPSGPTSDSPLTGSDLGLYAQSVIQPVDQWQLRVGVRYDAHYYPTSATAHATADQLSPRIRLSWFPSPQTTVWVYYGRQFIPTNTEDLRAITSASQGGVVSASTQPERDDYYDAGITHRFPVGVVVKVAAYHKKSSPGIDDTQVPGTAITTDVNIAEVRVTGIETTVEVRPSGPLSGFLNLALAHAYGTGAVTGGFFTTTPPAQPFDLDHDQRLSGTVGLTFSRAGWLVDATGIYGSGLTNGVTPNTPGRPLYDSTMAATPPLNTGLFAFNSAFKVKPSFIVDASAGYTFLIGNTEVRPQLFVDNLFDLHYVLKGAFFSGASFGRPRTLQFKVNLGV